MLIVLKALKSGVDVAKLAPIYNVNTLFAVLLGIIFLHEIPHPGEMIRVIIGAILIVIGSFFVSI